MEEYYKVGFVRYCKDELKKVKMCAFTSEYSEVAKDTVKKENEILSGEEHSKLSEIDLGEFFVDRKSTLRWYFSYLANYTKITSLGLLVKTLVDRAKDNPDAIGGGVLSLGAGPCVLEHMLADILPDMRVYACDYDSYMIDNARRQFKNITASQFDFYKDDAQTFVRDNDIRFVVMFGSSCSMDDEKYRDFLRGLHDSPVEGIITFEAGMVPPSSLMKSYIITLLYCCKHYFLTRDKKTLLRTGCFHAFCRTKSEFRRIYKASGWKFRELDKSLQTYPLISLLTR